MRENKICKKCGTEMRCQDDSFSHEFGTFQDHSWECDFCDEDHEIALAEYMLSVDDDEIVRHWKAFLYEYRHK